MGHSLREIAPIRTSLHDGTELLLRPIRTDDRERVKQSYQWLSEESRMNRFWEKPRELSDAWAARLVSDDGGKHLCWVALNPNEFDFPGYGGGSLWVDDNQESAEISFTVGDPWQRCGMATLFYSVLYWEGWNMGIRRLYGYSRIGNDAMVSWWEGIGGSVRKTQRQYELSLNLESPDRFISRVSYNLASGARQVEIAEWVRDWEEKLSG